MNLARVFLWRSSTRLSLFHRNISVSTAMGKIPDRWEEYQAVGKVVAGTRFICFKVPLNPNLSRSLPADVKRFLPDDLPAFIKEQDRELGIVIDLTNTTRYYREEEILKHGIDYKKIFTEGHMVPSSIVQNSFFQTVDDFLSSNGDNDRVIGVHCTHGLNRTGYLVCRYMIDRMNFKADDAIKAFNEARGHDMERQNYLSDLRGEPNSDVPSSSTDRRQERKRTSSAVLEDPAEATHSESKRRAVDNSYTRPSRNNDRWSHGDDRSHQSWQNSQSHYESRSCHDSSYPQHPQRDYNNDWYAFARQPYGYDQRGYNAYGNNYGGSWTKPHGYEQYNFASNDFSSHANFGGTSSFHHRGGRSHGQQFHDPRPQYGQYGRNEAGKNTSGSDRHYQRNDRKPWRGYNQS